MIHHIDKLWFHSVSFLSFTILLIWSVFNFIVNRDYFIETECRVVSYNLDIRFPDKYFEFKHIVTDIGEKSHCFKNNATQITGRKFYIQGGWESIPGYIALRHSYNYEAACYVSNDCSNFDWNWPDNESEIKSVIIGFLICIVSFLFISCSTWNIFLILKRLYKKYRHHKHSSRQRSRQQSRHINHSRSNSRSHRRISNNINRSRNNSNNKSRSDSRSDSRNRRPNHRRNFYLNPGLSASEHDLIGNILYKSRQIEQQ